MANVQIIDGKFYFSRDVVAAICGVVPETITKWKREHNPPPFDGDWVEAGALGEWIRNHQLFKKGRGGSFPYMPDMSRAPEVRLERPASMTLPGLDPAPSAGSESQKRLDKHSEETRLKRAQANKVEMENAITAGELIPKHEVETAFVNIATHVKARLLKIPSALAPVIVGIKDMYEVQQHIETDIREAMEELADWKNGNEDVDEPD